MTERRSRYPTVLKVSQHSDCLVVPMFSVIGSEFPGRAQDIMLSSRQTPPGWTGMHDSPAVSFESAAQISHASRRHRKNRIHLASGFDGPFGQFYAGRERRCGVGARMRALRMLDCPTSSRSLLLQRTQKTAAALAPALSVFCSRFRTGLPPD